MYTIVKNINYVKMINLDQLEYKNNKIILY